MAYPLRRSLVPLALTLALASCGGSKDPSVRLAVVAHSDAPLTVEGPLGTSLLVPADASATNVTIVVSAPGRRRAAPSQVVVVGPQIRLEPSGATFVKPLEITIPISPSDLPAGKTLDDVVVLRVDAGSDVFVPLATRRSGAAVIATTEHFCDFIPVVVDDAATPFGSCLDTICAPSETCADCPADCGECLPSPDTTPPMMLSAVGSGPASSLPTDTIFTILFDEPLLPSSVSIQSIMLDSNLGPLPFSFVLQGASLVVTPTSLIPAATTVNLSILGVRDLAGNVTTVMAAASFMTATQSPAFRVSSSPLSGMVGVHPRQDLILDFSDPIDAATFTLQPTDTTGAACTGSISVGDGTHCYAGAVVALSPTSIVIRPTTTLALGTSMAVNINTGAQDTFGYPVAPSTVLTFTTSPVNGFAYRIIRGAFRNGNRGGIAGADASCDPSGQGNLKAFLLASTRYPCATASCAGTETGPVDWVLQTNTTYVNDVGLMLFTTDATHPIFSGWPMPNTFRALGGLNFAWGGTSNVSDWLLDPTFTCSDWTTAAVAQFQSLGYEASNTAGFIAGGSFDCSANTPHLCVDQVPTTLPATH